MIKLNYVYNKNLYFIVLFLVFILFIDIVNNYLHDYLIEPLDSMNNSINGEKCQTITKETMKEIEKNSKNINSLNTDINNYNIKGLLTRINNVNDMITQNSDSLKDMATSSIQSTNSIINMDVRNDGTVYDNDGNLLYKDDDNENDENNENNEND